MAPVEAWLARANAALALGDRTQAQGLALAGRRWIVECAEQRLPAEFRDSFLHRHPVNRELMALASRLSTSLAP